MLAFLVALGERNRTGYPPPAPKVWLGRLGRRWAGSGQRERVLFVLRPETVEEGWGGVDRFMVIMITTQCTVACQTNREILILIIRILKRWIDVETT